MVKRGSKKSETLEVRISYDTKQRLLQRAKSENRTLSAIVRNLIEAYLDKPQSSATHLTFGDIVMRIKTFIIKRPKSALASLIAIATSSIFFIPSATAEDFQLNLQAEFIEPSEKDGIRTRKLNTDFELDFGSTVIFTLDGPAITVNKLDQNTSNDPIMSQDGRQFKLIIDETEIEDGEKALSIRVSIIDKLNGEELTLATPHIIAVYGETANFISEDGDKTFSLAFLPQKKT